MDIISGLIQNMDIISVLSGLVITGITQAVKKIQAIPISSGQVARIRTLVAVLSFASAFGQGYLDGNLADSNLIPILADAIISFIIATSSYKGYKLIK